MKTILIFTRKFNWFFGPLNLIMFMIKKTKKKKKKKKKGKKEKKALSCFQSWSKGYIVGGIAIHFKSTLTCKQRIKVIMRALRLCKWQRWSSIKSHKDRFFYRASWCFSHGRVKSSESWGVKSDGKAKRKCN